MSKISSPFDKLLRQYASIEAKFRLHEGDSKYGELVKADTNRNFPVQRWFHLKEAYSLSLLEELLGDWKVSTDSVHRILDPFCGIGTTLMASQKLAKTYGRDDVEAIGIERNPFLHFATQTKLRWHETGILSIKQQIAHLMNGAVIPGPRTIPELSTLHVGDDRIAVDAVPSAPGRLPRLLLS